MAISNYDRAAGWSAQLVQAHDTLRRRLQQLRSNLGDGDAAVSDLLSHCIAFCSALSGHHAGEDDGLFAELLRVDPALEPVVAGLVEDHRLIATILTSIQALAGEVRDANDARLQAIGYEIAGLAAIVESHFGYEERAIGNALDRGVRDTGWTGPVLGLRT